MSESPKVEFSSMKPFETGVDEQSVTILRNPADEMASVILTFQAKMPKQESLLLKKAISQSKNIRELIKQPFTILMAPMSLLKQAIRPKH